MERHDISNTILNDKVTSFLCIVILSLFLPFLSSPLSSFPSLSLSLTSRQLFIPDFMRALSFKHRHCRNHIKNPVLILGREKPLIIMANRASEFFFLFLLSLHSLCSSGTLVGFSYHARGNTASLSASRTISFLKLNEISSSQIRVFVADNSVLSTLSNSGVSVDVYLNRTLVTALINSKSSAASWLKTHIMTFLPHVNIKSFLLSSSSGDSPGHTDLPELLSTLKSIHSVLKSSRFDYEVPLSVAFSFSFIENLNETHGEDLHRVCGLINKTRSFIIVEASIDGELNMGDRFIQSAMERANQAASILSGCNVPMILIIKSAAVPSSIEVAGFSDKVSKYLENNSKVRGQIVELYAEVREPEREEELILPSSGRELLSSVKKALRDTINTPITPISKAPVTRPDNTTPTLVTVSPTDPVTIMPTNPASSPVPIPSTTPVTVPSTNPVNPLVPINNPVTTPAPITVPGAQPITNPVTTYPAPTGNVPVTTPVTNPVTSPVTNPVNPPVTTNAPAIPGQSWCVAKIGVPETALQAALDYACGIGGADCSQIQQGGSCYNPNTLQNHASYAFNSYYQKNPVASSCDFGGTANVVSSNPSTGSCIYPLLSSTTTTSPSTSTPTTAPATTSTSSSSGTGVSSSGTPATVLNSGNPASGNPIVFGSDTPPSVNTSTTSISSRLQVFVGCIGLITSFVAGIIILDM